MAIERMNLPATSGGATRLFPIDDLAHTPVNAPAWRESLAFSFHDSRGRISGMTTIGIWPRQNRGEGFAAILLETGQVFYSHTQVALDTPENTLLTVPGIHFTMLAPFREWRLAVQSDFGTGDVTATDGGVQTPRSSIPVYLALDFHAMGPVYEYPPRLDPSAGPTRHYEQNGHMLGRVVVDGQLYTVAGLGCRSHSWGREALPPAGDTVVVWVQFDAHLALNIWWSRHAGREVAQGTVLLDGTNLPVVSAAMAVTADAASGRPQAVQIKARTEDGRTWQLGGTVQAALPIDLPDDAAHRHLYACSARFRHNGLAGYGLLAVACPVGATTSSQEASTWNAETLLKMTTARSARRGSGPAAAGTNP
jgi:hypothetical protein